MAYVCELGTGQKVYLDNQGTQTIVTTFSSSLGQQQQASNGFQTGSWISPPEMFRTPNGVIIRINTAQGEHYIQVQGGSMSVIGGSPSLGSFQQMQVQEVASTPPSSMPSMEPMKPMEPMQPMKMGNMQMSSNPMEMRMGNMEMKMGSPTGGTRRFCSQCGAPINPSDRFCSSCGHSLS